MSALPSKSRIAFWIGVSRQMDYHFGYHRLMKISGPCEYVIEQLADGELLANLVSMDFIVNYLEAMKIVQRGTPLKIFLRHETPDHSHALDLWWADLDNDVIEKKRGYLTDNVRQAYLEAILNTELFNIDHDALRQSHQALHQALAQISETTPEWGAMYHILRIFEATLVHVARNHPATCERVRRTFVDEHDSSNRETCAKQAHEQALASNRRWQKALGLLKPEAIVYHLFREKT